MTATAKMLGRTGKLAWIRVSLSMKKKDEETFAIVESVKTNWQVRGRG